MRRTLDVVVISVLAALGLLLAGLVAAALGPQNIGLTRFEAVVEGSAISVEWDVETEIDTAGYKLKRGHNGVFAFLPDPDGEGDLFIAAEGGPAEGYEYSFLDSGVNAGQTYTYQLVEITIASSEVMQGETTVTMQAAANTTPIVLPTTNPGNNNLGTAATATATPTRGTATATALPTAQSTALPPTAVSAPTSIPAEEASVSDEPEIEPPPASDESPSDEPYPVPEEILEPPPQTDVVLEGQPAAVGVAAAQELPQVEGAYPGPAVNEPAAAVVESAAAGSAEEQPSAVGLPAPIIISGATTTGQDKQQEEGARATAVQDSPGEEGGLAFLWIAFLAALTIFIAAVIGAIVLYTRRPSG